jgi:hypothetical protein
MKWHMDDNRESDPEMMQMDGFDDCAVGTVSRFGMPSVLVYDLHKVIDKLISDGMSGEEAYEYYEFNMLGAWVGDGTPAFICLGGHDLSPINSPENSDLKSNIPSANTFKKNDGRIFNTAGDSVLVDDQANVRRIMENSCI